MFIIFSLIIDYLQVQHTSILYSGVWQVERQSLFEFLKAFLLRKQVI